MTYDAVIEAIREALNRVAKQETEQTAAMFNQLQRTTRERDEAYSALTAKTAELERMTAKLQLQASRWFGRTIRDASAPQSMPEHLRAELRRHNPEPGECACPQCSDFRLLLAFFARESNS